MKLQNSPKIYNNSKSDYPENTVKRIKEGFNEIGLQICYDEKNVSIQDFDIVLGHAFINELGWGQYGKATSKQLAMAGAYAELVERYSTGFIEFKIPLPKNPSIFQDLLHVVESRSFLRGYLKTDDHDSINVLNVNKFFVKDICQETYNLFKNEGLLNTLVDAYSFKTSKYEKIPTFLIDLNSTTNGLASGNTYEEAITQASFEIFERYAIIKIMTEKLLCPTIDQSSIKNHEIQKSISLLKSLNIEPIIKDMSLGNVVPVVGVLFINKNLEFEKNKLKKDRDYKRISVGSHFKLEEAIIRCFTEHLQMLILDKKGLHDKDKKTPSSLDILYDTWTKKMQKKYAGLDNEYKYFLRDYDYYGDYSFLEKGEKISIKKIHFPINNDFYDDVNTIIEICEKNNWELFIIDFTNKVLQFPTVRVIMSPISVDHDPFNRILIKSKNFEDRFNYFYGIKDFCKYLSSDKWINDEKSIKLLIKNIETYLSKELCYYCIYIRREDNFLQMINLFYILPFLHLAVKQYSEAKKYFELLLNLDCHPQMQSSFFDFLHKRKYDSKTYQKYIQLIDDHLDEKKSFFYNLQSNPFDHEVIDKNLEEKILLLLNKIGKSYN